MTKEPDPHNRLSHPWVKRLVVTHFDAVRPAQPIELENLSPGINLIHGANGSGKTTTARALRELLWNPEPSRDYRQIQARLQKENHAWNLQWDGVTPRVQALEGTQTSPPQAAPEISGRYFWSLRDLLQATDGDLARQVAREMAGGVDFQELSSKLGADKIPPNPRNLHDQYIKLSTRIREATQQQADLHQRAQKLGALQQERNAYESAYERVALLRRILELHRYEEERNELKNRLREFPGELQHAVLEDLNRVDRLEAALHDCSQRLDKQDLRIRDLGPGEKDWTHMTPDQIRTAQRGISHLISRYKETKEEEHHLQQELEELETADREFRKRLQLKDEQAEKLLKGVKVPEIRTWIEQVLREKRLSGEVTALDTRLSDVPETAGDPDSLRDAQRDLELWLKTGKTSTLPGWISSGTATALLGIALFVLTRNSGQHAWWVLLPLPLLVELTAQKLWGNRELQAIQLRYPPDVPAPESWEEESVRSTLKEVEAHLKEESRIRSFEPDRQRRELARIEHAEAKEALRTVTDVLFEQELGDRIPAEWAGHFLADVQEWRRLRLEAAQAENRLGEAEAQRVNVEERLRMEMSEWGKMGKQQDLLQYWERLKERLEKEEDRRDTLTALQVEEQHLRERQENLLEEQSEICGRLGVEAGDWAGARERLGRLEAYAVLQNRLHVREGQIRDIRESCRDADEWLGLDTPELEAEIEKGEQANEQAKALEKEIQKIRVEMEQATRGRKLHELREQQEAVREQLGEERAEIARALLAKTVVDWLREECRTERRPEVLETANAELRSITEGSLSLTLSLESGEERFMAGEREEDARPLDQLSSGERTQVLMAVRLAFLRHRESAPMPLFVDEVFGTSDDQRTEALLNTLVRIAAGGRQIFAFTAQTDEVGKWKQVLERPGPDPVPHRILDLDHIRFDTPVTPIRIPPTPPVAENPPERQDGESDAAWAERLGVPAWTPRQPVEDSHLFLWLRKDEESLVRSLRAGVRTWGALRALLNTGVDDLLAPGADAAHLQARARALQELAKAWRTGRPTPADPQRIIDSGIVSGTFLDPVLDLLRQHAGHAEPFLEALENKAVPRWRQENTEALRDLFLQSGALTQQKPLSHEEIRARAMATASDSPWGKHLTPDDWRELMAMLS